MDSENNLGMVPCGDVQFAEAWEKAQKMALYHNAVQGLDPENFDKDSKLTVDFLSKFTCADAFLLIESYGWGVEPGTRTNTWARFAQRHPNHTEVDWATVWTFWLFLKDGFKRWEGRNQWRRKLRSRRILGRISLADMHSLHQHIQAGKGWDSWVLGNTQYSQADWEEFFDVWFEPLRPYILGMPLKARQRNSRPLDSDEDLKNDLPLTKLALKYGPSVAFQYNDGQQVTQRSGLTPTEPPIGHRVQTLLEHEKRWEFVRYQQKYVGTGLSLRDLDLFDVISEKTHRSVKPSSLTNPILPFLEKEHWEVENGRYASHSLSDVLPDGRRINPAGNNEDLWEVMLPALRLVSMYLTECHLETWWDDLADGMSGNLIVMDRNADGRDGRTQYYFKRRHPSDRQKKKINWLLLLHRVKFSISSRGSQPAHWDACCAWDFDKTGFTDDGKRLSSDGPTGRYLLIYLKPWILITLLDPELSEADRLAQNAYLAKLFAHELAHAYFRIFSKRDDVGMPLEPAYEGDAFNELGWSMECAVFGGVVWRFIPDPRESDLKPANAPKTGLCPGLAVEVVPPVRVLREDQQLDRPAGSSKEENIVPNWKQKKWTRSPIALHFLEDIQQQGFWDVYTRAYGGELLKPRPMVSVHYDDALGGLNVPMNISYSSLLRRSLAVQPIPDWRNEDLSDPMAQKYVLKKIEQERLIAMKAELYYKERARHNAIRKRKSTQQDIREVEEYKNIRRKQKQEYDEKRMRFVQQLEVAAAVQKADGS